MKILLAAFNAKFIHSSLALRYLKAYAKQFQENIELAEYTINQQMDFILQDIYEKQPDIIGFSCYLWNINQIAVLCANLKKILPQIVILLGGPEVSYEPVASLERIPQADIVMRGEGEKTFYELCQMFLEKSIKLSQIQSITYRKDKEIISTDSRAPLSMNELPFVYESLDGLENKILYYETQRGCPYQCQYCLSSIEAGVRFRSLEKVFQELQFFLDNKVKQVKFVDRTFNCKKEHALSIWNYLIEHDNGITNFHMEITADILDEECMIALSSARKGLFQFEIGVQSTNETTIAAIRRNTSFVKLQAVVKKIKSFGTIHQHLDLIAGLPYEDYFSFRTSFNDVYSLKPEQLQLGFLKLLKGSGLRRDAEKYGIIFRNEAPYEVLFTNELSYPELLRLKAVEEMVETYYNSSKAIHTLQFVTAKYRSPFDFYEALGLFFQKEGFHRLQHTKIELFEIFQQFCAKDSLLKNDLTVIEELLKYDIFLGDNIKKLPAFLESMEEDKAFRHAFFQDEQAVLSNIPHLKNSTPQQRARLCRFIEFKINVSDVLKQPQKPIIWQKTMILFDYSMGARANAMQITK